MSKEKFKPIIHLEGWGEIIFVFICVGIISSILEHIFNHINITWK